MNTSPAKAATGDILPPFDLGQTWNICQGYNGPVSHTGTSEYGLDLTGAGCNNSAAGRNVRAPIGGTVSYYQASYGNLCVNIAGGRSYTLTHIDSSITSGSVTAGQLVGTVAAAGNRGNNNLAHIHFQMWGASNCYNSSVIPFDTAHGTRICGAPDLTPTGPNGGNGTWSGTSFTGADCSSGLGQMGPKVPLDDFGIYRVINGTGYWYVKRNDGTNATTYAVNGWAHGGWAGDIPLSGDFNRDGISDFVIYRIENGFGTWYVMDGRQNGAHLAIWGTQFGQPGDIPVVGDFTGDGYADFGVWRNGTWYIINGTNGQPTATYGAYFGQPGDVPLVGDFNGDKYADFGVWRSVGGTGYWYFINGTNGQQIPWMWGQTHGGWAQDVPVVADFNGDGYSDAGIYRPVGGTGYWYVKNGVNFGSMIINGAMHGGWNGDVPFSGNFG
ncbi:VCBS repeat domain-containing M23 family metallopeptidase [Acrocarpospora catenulata]|uniref:VCBS repeat domain-containing M23 family metallopeptidase n=1 Tax=Acrocarpospora catenulata TaxID=2836182 RepID=UPI001BDAE467|nr:VCBS repeat domain-containing M23 family metallopeptidase [Acrocarpospora catenulata]